MDPEASLEACIEDRYVELVRSVAVATRAAGTELVVVGYGMDAAAYDPDADTWTDLPAVPARFFEWNPELAATGDSVVAFMAQAVVVLHDGVWTPLPYEGLQFGDLAVADGTILTFGLDADAGVNSLFALDVETRRRDADVRQVGVAELRQPAGFEFGSAICDDADNECRDGVTVELEGPTSCAVTSSYTLGFGDPPDGERVTIEPLDGSPPFEATLTDPPDGGVHIVGAEVSDRIIVDCDDTEVALEVARSLVVPEYLRNQP